MSTKIKKTAWIKRAFSVLSWLGIVVLGIICFQIGASGNDDSVHPLPAPKIEKLDNGLTLAWFPQERMPIVDWVILQPCGFRSDPDKKSGTASLLAAILNRSIPEVERLGGSRFAIADEDTFTAGTHGLSGDSIELLNLLWQMTLNPKVDEVIFKQEKWKMKDRIQHVADTAPALAGFGFLRAIANGTPYGRGEVSSIAELEKVTLQDVLQFHKRCFKPDTAVLMGVGPIDARARGEVVSKFGAGWVGGAGGGLSNIPDRIVENSLFKTVPNEVLLIDRPDLSQVQVRVGVRMPGGPQNPDRYSLAVGNALLGEYFNSRLNLELRDREGLSYSVGSSFAHHKDLSVFYVTASTRNKKTGELLKRLRDLLERFVDGPIAQNEVDSAKDYLIGGFPLAMATVGAVASRWLSGVVFGFGPDYLNEFVPEVKKVTAKDVMTAVKKNISLSRMVWVVSGDAKKITPVLKQSGFKVRVLAADKLF